MPFSENPSGIFFRKHMVYMEFLIGDLERVPRPPKIFLVPKIIEKGGEGRRARWRATR